MTPQSRSSHGAKRYCFIYKELQALILFSISSDNCNRNIRPGVDGELAFNVTVSGKLNIFLLDSRDLILFIPKKVIISNHENKIYLSSLITVEYKSPISFCLIILWLLIIYKYKYKIKKDIVFK